MIDQLAVAGSGGLVHRDEHGVTLVEAGAVSDPGEPQLHEVFAELRPAERRDSWRKAAERGELPTMAVLIEIEGEWTVMLCGQVSVIARTPFGSVDARPHGDGIYEHRLHRDVTEVHLSLDADVGVAGPMDHAVDLQAGSVVCGRVVAVFARAEVPAGEAAAVSPAVPLVGGAAAELDSSDIPAVALADNGAGDPFESFDLDVPVVLPEPLPVAAVESVPPAPVAEDPATAAPVPIPPAPVPAAAAEPVAAAEQEPAAAEQESVESGQQGAQVRGVRCPVDHHNHPNASYCSQCGRKMGVNLTTVLVMGERPPLGLLIVDDGTTIPLAADVVVGRDPRSHSAVLDGTAIAVLVPDDSLGLSRAHATFTLHEWDVVVTDLGSSNGTFVRHEDTTVWIPLAPHQPAALTAGDTIRLAGREMLLELHHIS